MRRTIVLLACCGLAASAQAGPRPGTGTHFGLKQIVINDSTAVGASALNNAGTIAGAYSDSQGPHGFIRQDKVVTVLPTVTTDCPAPSGCVAVPQAINDAGDVVAEFDGGFATSVLWKNGAYVGNSYVELSSSGATMGVLGLNRSDEEVFNFDAGPGGLYPEAGIPPNVVLVNIPGDSPLLSGLNNRGVLVGRSGLQVNGSEIEAAFAGGNGSYTTIAPPGATYVYSAAINDHGDVAGSYWDASHAYHGFVYAKGKYTVFDVPAKASALMVGGINNLGRVIGVYTDPARSEQRLFWYNGSTVTGFGRFSEYDYVFPALNDRGEGIVQDSTGPTQTSYTILCTGPGC